jgi:hypothetical protein
MLTQLIKKLKQSRLTQAELPNRSSSARCTASVSSDASVSVMMMCLERIPRAAASKLKDASARAWGA